MRPSPAQAIVDLRDPEAYAHERPVAAVHLSLEDLLERAYLLPPRSRPLLLVGRSATEIASALEVLRQAGRNVRHLAGETWRQELALERGESTRLRLWEESPTLSRAVEQYGDSLPGNVALDIACGSGRNAVYLALHGFRVTGIDRLPEALERAHDLAQRSAVTISARKLDLEQPQALEGLRADLIVVVRYLERSLFPALQNLLTPGGVLVYETFTKAQAVFGHPRNPRYMLEEQELSKAFPALQTLNYEEGLFDGAHLACLVARRPG